MFRVGRRAYAIPLLTLGVITFIAWTSTSSLWKQTLALKCTPQSPSSVLVSVAIGAAYEAQLPKLKSTLGGAGFTKSQLWTASNLEEDSIFKKYKVQFEKLFHMKNGYSSIGHQFPYCGAFKPLALLRAMLESCTGDYIMWTDASRHLDVGLKGANVLDAIHALRQEHDFVARSLNNAWSKVDLRSVSKRSHNIYGQMLCSSTAAYGDLLRKFGVAVEEGGNDDGRKLCEPNAPSNLPSVTETAFSSENTSNPSVGSVHINLRNMLIENSPQNIKLMWEWLRLAFDDPVAFCAPWTPEESSLLYLLARHSLPVYSSCMFELAQSNPDTYTSPSSFLQRVSSSKYFFVPSTMSCSSDAMPVSPAQWLSVVNEKVHQFHIRANLTSS